MGGEHERLYRGLTMAIPATLDIYTPYSTISQSDSLEIRAEFLLHGRSDVRLSHRTIRYLLYLYAGRSDGSFDVDFGSFVMSGPKGWRVERGTAVSAHEPLSRLSCAANNLPVSS